MIAEGVRTVPRPSTARVVEIFSSIQGEAALIGVRQIFLRFFGCNLRCAWCDSPETLVAPKGPLLPARVEQTPGRADFRPLPNPAPAEAVLEAVLHLERQARHHSVSLTGGEPLLHARFLERFLPELRALGLRAYLETNGLLPEHLRRIAPLVDWIAMDLKPPSCTGDPCPDWLERHRAFMRVAGDAAPRPELLLKLIVSATAEEAELRAAFRLAAAEAPGASLTLQPVTPLPGDTRPVARPPEMETLLRWHAVASEYVAEVRLLPQLHKLMRLL